MIEVPKPARRKRLPYWAAMLLGVVGCAITANVLTIAMQFGAFNTWASLPVAPSGTMQIVDADETNVWVGTGDGKVFWYELYCIGKSTCRQWVSVPNVSDIKASRVVPLQIDQQCPKSGSALFPLTPTGRMVECVLVAFPGPEMGSVTYYALMSDGLVKLWRNSNSMIAQYTFFFLSTIVVPVVVAVIISALYLGIHIGRKQLAEDQKRMVKGE
jgi:hypothetical protein